MCAVRDVISFQVAYSNEIAVVVVLIFNDLNLNLQSVTMVSLTAIGNLGSS